MAQGQVESLPNDGLVCSSCRPPRTPCRRHAASSRPASRLLNRTPSPGRWLGRPADWAWRTKPCSHPDRPCRSGCCRPGCRAEGRNRPEPMALRMVLSLTRSTPAASRIVSRPTSRPSAATTPTACSGGADGRRGGNADRRRVMIAASRPQGAAAGESWVIGAGEWHDGNKQKNGTKARERLWPFVTYDQYTRLAFAVKRFSWRPIGESRLHRQCTVRGAAGVFSTGPGAGQSQPACYTEGCT